MGEIYSMTGYGEGVWDFEGCRYHINIKSFNHRYLDIRVKLPAIFDTWEFETIKRIKEKFDRGRIELYVSEVSGEGVGKPEVDIALAEKYGEILNSLKDRLGFKGDVEIDTLVRMKGVVYISKYQEGLEDLWEGFVSALDGVLDALLDERRREGIKLMEDLEGRLENLLKIAYEVEEEAPGMVGDYRERLTGRVNELLEKEGLDPGRIEQEVVIFSERSDITEECVRLKSHIEGFRGATTSGSPAGRKLDFFLQEMGREVNTIGSKVTSKRITGLVVDAKVEIEKMRQQVQNIE